MAKQSKSPPRVRSPFCPKADTLLWIQDRLVTLTVLEALLCLDEGVIKEPDDLDCAMCLSGWATHRGGPVGYVRQIGREVMVARCNYLTNLYGADFVFTEAAQRFLTKADDVTCGFVIMLRESVDPFLNALQNTVRCQLSLLFPVNVESPETLVGLIR